MRLRDAKADNVQQAVKMAKPGKMYAALNLKSEVVRDLDPGMMLYPTGDKMGVWWKVTDELGNEGWVVSTNFQLARSPVDFRPIRVARRRQCAPPFASPSTPKLLKMQAIICSAAPHITLADAGCRETDRLCSLSQE